MKFKLGHEKLGGRKRGIPNRRTRHLYEALEANGYSVVENLIKIIPRLEPAKQADVYLDLMQYL